MRILVTGGAGFIGSETVKQLLHAGHSVIVVDNFSTGSMRALPINENLSTFNMNVSELSGHRYPEKIDAVIHFAASISVEESVKDPLKYYKNNTANVISVLEFCKKEGISKLIFSSTAAVYGEVKSNEPITEDYQTSPINAYGHSKLMSEQIIKDFAKAEPWFNYVILRYFNVTGPGKRNLQATDLVSNICRTACGLQSEVKIYGDGSAVRDFIHVSDLAAAHIVSLEHLVCSTISETFNVGTGKGHSVMRVINGVEDEIWLDFVKRREGDPQKVVADNTKICTMTHWWPKHADIDQQVKDSLNFMRELLDEPQ